MKIKATVPSLTITKKTYNSTSIGAVTIVVKVESSVEVELYMISVVAIVKVKLG